MKSISAYTVKSIALGVILLALISSCKVSQKSQKDPYLDSIAMQLDTLIKLPPVEIAEQDSVELNIYRVLKDTVSIVGVGDIMMGTNFPEEYYLPPNEGRDLLSGVDSILRSADITFGNLEGVILNEGGNPKYCSNPKLCYIFRSPEYMVQNLKDAGFDVMSTANNHAGDFGNPGRENTMKVLDSLGIYHAGLVSRPYVTFMKDGMRYGFAAFAPNSGTMSIHDLAKAKAIISHLDSISDIVIASFHGGAEGSKYQHVERKTEYFYGENRGNVYRFSHELVNSGADIVFGHGPHVTRAVEVYNKRFIAYSLGNFCTYARFNLSGDNGLAPIINVFTSSKGEFYKAQVTPVIQRAPGGPQVDHKKRVIKRLQSLTSKDFPEVKIKIDDSGLITYIQD